MSSGADPADRRPARVLVTGANGFVGSALCASLEAYGLQVRRAVRSVLPDAPRDTVAVGEIGPDTQWAEALRGVDAVVHLAARVHLLHEAAADPLTEYRRVNVEGTQQLARAASEAGLPRLVFLSSIKVNGETTVRPFTEADPPAPRDPYGRSKWEAEQVLARISARSGLQTVVLRPPLIYGPGVRANFLRLMRALARGLPLPLAAINNRRSLLYLGNLVDAIRVCLTHPAAPGRTYLISDGEDLSTPDLARRLARALGTHARLVPVPIGLLRLAAAVTGRRAAAERLIESLQVDGTALRRDTGWAPQIGVDQGLAQTAHWFRRTAG